MKKSYLVIDQQEKLSILANEIDLCTSIAIDTEFVRRTTYYPKLRLIQLNINKKIFLLDIPNLSDLLVIKLLLADINKVKIIHAASQDFEIFFQLFGEIPRNIFDTQAAARICGLGQYLSYQNLCLQLLGIEIDKTLQKCDWGTQTITPEMYKYAANDVYHLPELYRILTTKLNETKTNELFAQEQTELFNIEKYKLNPNDAWKKIKIPGRYSKFLERIKMLAAYREESASLLDIPRGHFISDHDLITICEHLPTDQIELKKLHIHNRFLKKQKFADIIFSLCAGFKEEDSFQ